MTFLSMRELRSDAKRIKRLANKEGEVVVTNNGKPEFILIGVDEKNFIDRVGFSKRMRLLETMHSIQKDSMKNNSCNMSMEEIDAEIAKTRKTFKKGSAKRSA